MMSDQAAASLTAAIRDHEAAQRDLAGAVRALTARLGPSVADMDSKTLMDLAWDKRLDEPWTPDLTTHQGRVEQRGRQMLAMEREERESGLASPQGDEAVGAGC